MGSRIDLLKELGTRRSVVLAATSLALYAAMAITVLVVRQPAETGNALADFVSPTASASTLGPDQPSPEEILPTSAQAKTWDEVQYGAHDFDPLPGQFED